MPEMRHNNGNKPMSRQPKEGPVDEQDPVIKKIITELDNQAQFLDAATASRLNQSRQAAIASMRSRQRAWARWGLPLGLAGTAAAGMVAIALWMGGANPEQPGLGDPALADLALLTSEDSLEFYENLEFYQWLETELDAG